MEFKIIWSGKYGSTPMDGEFTVQAADFDQAQELASRKIARDYDMPAAHMIIELVEGVYEDER